MVSWVGLGSVVITICFCVVMSGGAPFRVLSPSMANNTRHQYFLKVAVILE